MSSCKVLLGVDNNNNICFGEFEVTERNGYPEFSASFDLEEPFNGSALDLVQHYQTEISCFDAAYKCSLYEEYDCKPSELAQVMADECDDARDAFDCSTFPEEVIIGTESWFFKSAVGGQYDLRKTGMKIYSNIVVFDKLYELWDKYHLKKVDERVIEEVNALIELCEKINEHEIELLEEYIRKIVLDE